MGREIKRVPIGFDWPLREVWWGYIMESVVCKACNGTGKASAPTIGGWKRPDGTWYVSEDKNEDCPVCDGEGYVCPMIEVPPGPGYQLWETTTEGSPLSPSLSTPEELARWLADNNVSAFGGITLPYESWLAFILGVGWAPSMVFSPETGLISGVEVAIRMDT